MELDIAGYFRSLDLAVMRCVFFAVLRFRSTVFSLMISRAVSNSPASANVAATIDVSNSSAIFFKIFIVYLLSRFAFYASAFIGRDKVTIGFVTSFNSFFKSIPFLS